MRTGRTLQEIAAELERQATTRRDYLAPQGKLDATVIDGEVVVDGLPHEPALALTPYAHGQMAAHLGIPKAYYDRMATEQPELLAANLNTWLHAAPADKRLVRALDGRVRAVLSHKFRPLDNYDLAQAVLPTLVKQRVQIVSAELTETRLYIKGILPSLSSPEPVGAQWGRSHVVSGAPLLVAAIVISNSDLGAGTLRVEPSVFTTRCTNLAILAQAAMKKYHVGRAWEAGDSFEAFRDDTRRADDTAFWMKVRDVTVAAFDPHAFKAAIAAIRQAAARPIDSTDLPTVVEMAVEQLGLPERTSGSILTHLARGGELTQWGLSAAITATAESQTDLSYEEATQLERAGGDVIALAPKQWTAIAKAA